MTAQSVPCDISYIATRIEEEAGNLKVCRSLMNQALQFSYVNAEEVGLAQSQLFFLVAALGELEKRLDEIEDDCILHTIAGRIEEEARNLKVCRSLMNQALQFSYVNAEEVGLAQSQLFFLVAALGDLEKRLDKLQAAAYDMARTEQAAA